jgi:hypothetical protein
MTGPKNLVRFSDSVQVGITKEETQGRKIIKIRQKKEGIERKTKRDTKGKIKSAKEKCTEVKERNVKKNPSTQSKNTVIRINNLYFVTSKKVVKAETHVT